MRSIALLGLVAVISCVDARRLDSRAAEAKSSLVTAGNSTTATTHPHHSSATSIKTTAKTTKTTASTSPKKGKATSTSATPSKPTTTPLNLKLACDGNEGCQEQWPSNNYVFPLIAGKSGDHNGSLAKDVLWYESSSAPVTFVVNATSRRLYEHTTFGPDKTGYVGEHHTGSYFAHIDPAALPSKFYFANESTASTYGLQPLDCVRNTHGAGKGFFYTDRIDCSLGGVAYRPMICPTVLANAVVVSHKAQKDCYFMQFAVQVPVS